MATPPPGKIEVQCYVCPAEYCEWVTVSWLACSLHMEERHPLEAAAGLEPEEGVMWVHLNCELTWATRTGDLSPGT